MDYPLPDYNDMSLEGEEGDPFAEIDQEFSKYVDGLRYTLMIHAGLDILDLVACLLVTSVYIFLVITIVRFKRLRTRINMYILNMCLLGILFYFVVPLSVILLKIVFDYTINYKGLFAFQHILFILYLTFATALALDWFFSGYKPGLLDKYNAYFKFVIGGLYLLSFLVLYLGVSSNHGIGNLSHKFSLVTVFYCVYLAILVAINLLKNRIIDKNDSIKTAYALTVSNITIFAILLIHVYIFITIILREIASEVGKLVILLDPLFVLVPVCHPILIAYMLGRENKYFKMAYNRTFRRSSVRNYADDNLDKVSKVDNSQNNRVAVNFATENGQGDNNILVI